jgi:lysophospholipase L1-like esterase
MKPCWSRVALVAAAVFLSTVSVAAQKPGSGEQWVQAWYSPPFPPTAVLGAEDIRIYARQTVRQVVRLNVGGQGLRVRLTNELGLTPVMIGSVHVALSSPNGVTQPETDHVLTFNGRRDAQIPVGQALVSDPVQMSVAAFDDLGISVYYPGHLAPSGHLLNVRVSARGDHGAEDLWPGSSLGRGPALVSGVEVQAPGAHHVIVAFGDSITEGAGATLGTHQDWPEQLAQRISNRGWVVINSGIGGNRLLHEGSGPKAPDRFDRDALQLSGVSAIVLTEGINDIGWAFDSDGDSGPITAADIEAVDQQLIARAHARGIKVYGGTLEPYEGAKYFHPEGEVVREAVNQWIRTSGAFDGVIDFEQTVRDPKHPTRYLGKDQSGDSLHPNDAGYHAMAEAVDPKLFP